MAKSSRKMLWGEALIVEDFSTHVVARPASEEETWCIGHIEYDQRARIGSKILFALNLNPRCMGHVSLDRVMREDFKKGVVVVYQSGGRNSP